MFEKGGGGYRQQRFGRRLQGGWKLLPLQSCQFPEIADGATEKQNSLVGGGVTFTASYRKRENLNDISEVERMHGWRVCAWMGEREVVLPEKILGGRLEWRFAGRGSNSREHDFEAPLGTPWGCWGSGRRGWESPGDRGQAECRREGRMKSDVGNEWRDHSPVRIQVSLETMSSLNNYWRIPQSCDLPSYLSRHKVRICIPDSGVITPELEVLEVDNRALRLWRNSTGSHRKEEAGHRKGLPWVVAFVLS